MVEGIRQAIESLYEGRCEVIEKMPIKDPVTRITKFGEVTVYSNQLCRLSFGNAPTTADSGIGVAIQTQTVKLFIAPEILIEPGSQLIVTQNNQVGRYKRSGLPAVYTSHQEVNLTIWDTWT